MKLYEAIVGAVFAYALGGCNSTQTKEGAKSQLEGVVSYASQDSQEKKSKPDLRARLMGVSQETGIPFQTVVGSYHQYLVDQFKQMTQDLKKKWQVFKPVLDQKYWRQKVPGKR